MPESNEDNVFELKFKLGNDESQMRREIVKALKKVAKDVEDIDKKLFLNRSFSGIVVDIYGKSVGQFYFRRGFKKDA